MSRYGYVPLPRTCQRCGLKGNTNTVQSRIIFKPKSEVVSSIHLNKWQDYCDQCADEVLEIINKHLESMPNLEIRTK